MSLPLILGAAIVGIVFAVASARVWADRFRRVSEDPVTEADARAHAMPLTKSVLSVGPASRDRVRSDL